MCLEVLQASVLASVLHRLAPSLMAGRCAVGLLTVSCDLQEPEEGTEMEEEEIEELREALESDFELG